LPEALHGGRQKRQRDPWRHADRQFARSRAAQCFDLGLCSLQLPQHHPRMHDQRAAELGERDTARAAHQQRRLQIGFEFPHRLGHGSRRNTQRARRGPDTSGIRDGGQGTELM
jgi:hypothetical protein